MIKATRVLSVRGLRGGAFGAALVLAGCAPLDRPGALNFPFLDSYDAARNSAPLLLSNDAWWQRLDDPALDQLITQALSQNLDLAVSIERIRQAQAEAASVTGAVSLTPGIGLQREGLTNGAAETTGTASVGFDWLLDPFGGRAATKRAAVARVDVAAAEADAARLLVLLNTANTYVELRYRQRLVALRDRELAGRKRTLALTRDMAAADEATRLDITRSQARVAELETSLPRLRADVQASLNELAVLVGAMPGQFELPAGRSGHIPHPDLNPEVGIPTDLLRNRPDIRVAERGYYVALAELEASEAARYPSLSLSGSISVNLLSPNTGGAQYFFGPTLAVPDIIGGRNQAAAVARQSALRQAHSGWKSTVLGAIVEVENALLDYQAVTASASSAARATRLYSEARSLTEDVFTAGESTLTELINAEQSVVDAEIAQAQTARARALAFVALNVRIGAGHAVTGAR